MSNFHTLRFAGLFLVAILFGLNAAHGDSPPGPDAITLDHIPADYDWWNGCSPTAAGMLFGWWEEEGEGYDAFPGNHRNLPATYSSTSTDPDDYADARGVIAGWAHKQSGMALGWTYGSYGDATHFPHAPDSIADFIQTSDGATWRSATTWGLKVFGAWDDPRTPEIESQRFITTNRWKGQWDYDDYVDEIDAGRPVHLGLVKNSGGHSVLGVGYNETDGKENFVLLTTWHHGLQEWEWDNTDADEYSFTAATTMQPAAGDTPTLSAYFSLAHTDVGDLTVKLGVGDPSNPDWSITAWDYDDEYHRDNLALTDIDCTDMLDEFLADPLDWYLEVYDDKTGDVGTIQDFQIRYNFDESVTYYGGGPVAINDGATSYVYLQTVPEPGTMALLAAGMASLVLVTWRRRRRL